MISISNRILKLYINKFIYIKKISKIKKKKNIFLIINYNKLLEQYYFPSSKVPVGHVQNGGLILSPLQTSQVLGAYRQE